MDTPPSRRWSITPHSTVWVMHRGFLPKSTVWGGEEKRVTLWCRKMEKHDFIQALEINIHIGKPYVYVPLIWGDGILLLWYFFWKPETQSSQEKKITQVSFKERTTKCLAVLLQKQEEVRNCHSQEGPQETWQLNTMWPLGWDPETEKGYEVKTKEFWTKYIV